MATDWTAEQKGVYEDFKSEGFEVVIQTPATATEFDEGIMDYWSEGDDVNVTTYALKKSYYSNQIDGTVIRQNDTMLVFPAYGLSAIDTTKKILVDSVELNVVNISKVDPGNVALLYTAQIRG